MSIKIKGQKNHLKKLIKKKKKKRKIFNRLIIIYIMIESYFNVTKLNSMKFIQNSSNMNLKTTKQKCFNS